MTRSFCSWAVLCAIVALLAPAPASANCLGENTAQRLAYQSAAGAGAIRPMFNNPFEPTARDRDDPIIVGLWKVTFTSGGQVTDIGFDAWHSDGTEILNDISPISHNVCLGVWKQTGPRTFELKHMVLRFDASGAFIGTAVLRETNTVNRTGHAFDGTFTLDFIDLEGNTIFTASGAVSGERVTVD